jgi:hypothetical protein
LSSEILSSTFSSLLVWPSTVFCLIKGTFYFQDFCLILFFWKFSISLFNSSFIFYVVIFNS